MSRPMFKLAFNTDNAAFSGDPLEEVARILAEVGGRVLTGADAGSIVDANGNRVGEWEFS